MTDAGRRDRNTARLKECYPTFRQRVELLIQRMETRGFRPRIQTAARSIADQLDAYNRGTSKIKFGYHNVTGANGPEALAVDILDDDAPLAPSIQYLLSLAIEARAIGCQTGITWGLPPAMEMKLEVAIANGQIIHGVKVGWDPCHVEIVGLSLQRVKAGERPPALSL